MILSCELPLSYHNQQQYNMLHSGKETQKGTKSNAVLQILYITQIES